MPASETLLRRGRGTREILFRGKSVFNGKWVYGYLYVYGRNNAAEISYYNKDLNMERMSAVVIPETVGQYTGLTDENGKKIFEGDIVLDQFSCESFGFVGEVVYNSERTEFEIFNSRLPGYIVTLGSRRLSVKIIGNIHDNPELIESEVE